VAYDPGRVIETSQMLLGNPAPANPMARRLFSASHPDWLVPAGKGVFFRLYAIDPRED
jgi:hypothetical protein